MLEIDEEKLRNRAATTVATRLKTFYDALELHIEEMLRLLNKVSTTSCMAQIRIVSRKPNIALTAESSLLWHSFCPKITKQRKRVVYSAIYESVAIR